MLVRPGRAEAHAKAGAVRTAAAAAHAGVVAGREVGAAHAGNVLQGVGAAVLDDVLGRPGHRTVQEKWSRSFEQLNPVAKRDRWGHAACISANGSAAKYASSGVAWPCA